MLTQLPFSRISGITFPAVPTPQACTQLALQYQLESSQWWLQDVLLAHQLRELQSLLRHAVASTPYYAELFVQHGLTVPERMTVDFLQQIPISRRTAIQQAGNRIESTQLPADHGGVEFSTTSGSTGRPVRFARTGLTHSLWLAFALRDHLWHARDFTGKLCAIRWYPRGAAEPPEGAHQADWGNIVAPLFASGPAASLNVVATLEQQVDWLMRERPDCLVSFPSNLAALARYAVAQNVELPPVREIRTVGETLTDQVRDLLTQSWKTKVTDVYSCEEAGYLALQCPQTDHYHVQSENVLLEIVDEEGKACPPGKMGQVLITTLHNFATPLIRYEVGDMAEFGEPCACGRGLPVIRKIHGRKRNRLQLPSGQSVFPYLGEHGETTRQTGVKVHQFQCIQHSLEEVELKLVVERPFTEDEQARVAERMQVHLGHPFRIVFSFPDAIPLGPTGKFEEFISHL